MRAQVRLLTPWICVAMAASTSRADEPDEPKVGWAIAGGTATALVPMAIAGAYFANTFNTTERRDATIGMLSGMALAPIVSHLAVKEWARAAIFGVVPVACAIGTGVLLKIEPTADLYGTREGRLTFGLLLTFATLASGVGLLDTVGATRRAADPRRVMHTPVVPVPFATAHGGGLVAGGLF